MACVVCAGVKARCNNCGGFLKGAKTTKVKQDPLEVIEEYRQQTIDKMIETKNKADARSRPDAEAVDNWLGKYGSNN